MMIIYRHIWNTSSNIGFRAATLHSGVAGEELASSARNITGYKGENQVIVT